MSVLIVDVLLKARHQHVLKHNQNRITYIQDSHKSKLESRKSAPNMQVISSFALPSAYLIFSWLILPFAASNLNVTNYCHFDVNVYTRQNGHTSNKTIRQTNSSMYYYDGIVASQSTPGLAISAIDQASDVRMDMSAPAGNYLTAFVSLDHGNTNYNLTSPTGGKTEFTEAKQELLESSYNCRSLQLNGSNKHDSNRCEKKAVPLELNLCAWQAKMTRGP